MALLDAVRALSSFAPPRALPPCDLEELLAVLDAHGLAPLASYHVETRLLGAGLPDWFRERLLAVYQGVVNDNVLKLVTLKQALAKVPVPVLLLGAASFLDWLYPHLAFRPVGEPRLLVRGADGAAFAAAITPDWRPQETGEGGHTASFTNGQFPIHLQEGLVAGKGDDLGAFARGEPLPAVGPTAARPSAEDALLVAAADVALQGLYAPLLEYVDLRELLLRVDLARAGELRARADAAGLTRGLAGALRVTAHYFPEVAGAADALAPPLARGEEAAVQTVVEQAGDPAKLRVLRGAVEAARAVVAPR